MHRLFTCATSILVAGGLLLVVLGLLAPGATAHAGTLTVRFVAADGNCGSNSPCYDTIQAAVDEAAAGDIVRVAGGRYTGVSARGGATQLVYLDRSLMIQGSYDPLLWTVDPANHPSILDAEDQGRVLYITGVVSPVLWIGLTGLTGGAVYKAINTADSMIGHRSERYEDFGRAAAKLDDAVNLPGSRLSGVLLVCAAGLTGGASAPRAWRTMCRDAAKHASPNAGYPEAAMAGALGVALGGPRTYAGSQFVGTWLGDGRRDAAAKDIRAALRLYATADALLVAAVAIIAAITATM